MRKYWFKKSKVIDESISTTPCSMACFFYPMLCSFLLPTVSPWHMLCKSIEMPYETICWRSTVFMIIFGFSKLFFWRCICYVIEKAKSAPSRKENNIFVQLCAATTMFKQEPRVSVFFINLPARNIVLRGEYVVTNSFSSPQIMTVSPPPVLNSTCLSFFFVNFDFYQPSS